jgi:hypothetical protein
VVVFCDLRSSGVCYSSVTYDRQLSHAEAGSAAVFLLILTIPTVDWFTKSDVVWKRVALVVTILLITSQGLLFQWQYRKSAHSPRRLHLFDADYTTTILPTAMTNSGSEPVYLADNSSRPDTFRLSGTEP